MSHNALFFNDVFLLLIEGLSRMSDVLVNSDSRLMILKEIPRFFIK